MLAEIEQRTSTRSFDWVGPDAKEDDLVAELLNHIPLFPDGPPVRVCKLRHDELKHDLSSFARYGYLQGKADYLVVLMTRQKNAALSAGFALSYLSLELTRLGLDNCIVSGTFRRKELLSQIRPQVGELIAAVIFYGHGSGRAGFLEKNAKRIFPRRRKEFNELFFQQNFDYQITKVLDPPLLEALKAMRSAPSSVNSQPWRVVLEAQLLHIYMLNRPPLLSDPEIRLIDMGIGIHHLVHELHHQGLAHRFLRLNKGDAHSAKYLGTIEINTRDPLS